MIKLPVAIDPNEFAQLIKRTKKKKYKIAFLLGFGAGLRISEIVGLKRKDETEIEALTKERVNMDEKKILIKGAKGKKDRIVPLPKGFREEYLNYLPISKSYKNTNSARRGLQRAFKTAAKKAKLLEKKPELHFHSLRHGFGSQLANQGVPIHHIRTLMGHSNISTTNIYLEANPKEALKAYEDLF